MAQSKLLDSEVSCSGQEWIYNSIEEIMNWMATGRIVIILASHIAYGRYCRRHDETQLQIEKWKKTAMLAFS